MSSRIKSYRSLLLGALFGVLAAPVTLMTIGLDSTEWGRAFSHGVAVLPAPADPTNDAVAFGDLKKPCVWSRLSIRKGGFSTDRIDNYEILRRHLSINEPRSTSITIPILPSVYPPTLVDKLYFDTILESDIQAGDKVLVIGCGSGADSWVVSSKSKSTVYAIDINPMAVMNTRFTAKVGGFEVKPIHGDFRSIDLPDDFGDFDYVVWNMPFVEVDAYEENYASRAYHDGDDGSVLQNLLGRLPTMLKPGGQAILLNYAYARNWINSPGVVTKVDPQTKTITNTTFMVFLVPNPATPPATDSDP